LALDMRSATNAHQAYLMQGTEPVLTQ